MAMGWWILASHNEEIREISLFRQIGSFFFLRGGLGGRGLRGILGVWCGWCGGVKCFWVGKLSNTISGSSIGFLALVFAQRIVIEWGAVTTLFINADQGWSVSEGQLSARADLELPRFCSRARPNPLCNRQSWEERR